MIVAFLYSLALTDQFPPPFYEVLNDASLKIYRYSDEKFVYEHKGKATTGFATRTQGWWSRSGNLFVLPWRDGILVWSSKLGAKSIDYPTDRPVDYCLDTIAISGDENLILYRVGISGDYFLNSGSLYMANFKYGSTLFIDDGVRTFQFKEHDVSYRTVLFGENSLVNGTISKQKNWRIKRGF